MNYKKIIALLLALTVYAVSLPWNVKSATAPPLGRFSGIVIDNTATVLPQQGTFITKDPWTDVRAHRVSGQTVDNVTNIQAALNVGGRILFPYLSAGYSFANDAYISPVSNSIIDFDGNVLHFASGAGISSAIWISAVDNVILRNFTVASTNDQVFTGNATAPGSNVYGVSIQNSSNISIEHYNGLNLSYAIKLNSGNNNIKVTDLWTDNVWTSFYGGGTDNLVGRNWNLSPPYSNLDAYNHNVYIAGGSVNWLIDGLTCRGAGYYCIQTDSMGASPATGIIINNLEMYNVPGGAFISHGSGIQINNVYATNDGTGLDNVGARIYTNNYFRALSTNTDGFTVNNLVIDGQDNSYSGLLYAYTGAINIKFSGGLVKPRPSSTSVYLEGGGVEVSIDGYKWVNAKSITDASFATLAATGGNTLVLKNSEVYFDGVNTQGVFRASTSDSNPYNLSVDNSRFINTGTLFSGGAALSYAPDTGVGSLVNFNGGSVQGFSAITTDNGTLYKNIYHVENDSIWSTGGIQTGSGPAAPTSGTWNTGDFWKKTVSTDNVLGWQYNSGWKAMSVTLAP